MNNSLDQRIQRLRHAIGQVRSEDLSLFPPKFRTVANVRIVEINMSEGQSEVELENLLSMFIANIASLKDYFKKWCVVNGSHFTGDDLINHNRDVAIIHDLWNLDKHGSLRDSRSNLFPKLRDISRVIVLSTQDKKDSRIALLLNPRTGQLETRGDGKAEVVIDAEIVDSTENHVGRFAAISAKAVDAWEKTLVSAGVVLPSR